MFQKEFTPEFFLKLVLKHLKFIILLTLFGGILCLLYANFFVTPQYSASAMVIVQNYTLQDAAKESAVAQKYAGIGVAVYSISAFALTAYIMYRIDEILPCASLFILWSIVGKHILVYNKKECHN